jgi:hypothetical protein
VEMMCFVFVILSTETRKVKNLEIHYQVQQQSYELLKNQLENNKELRKKFLSTLKNK